MFLNTPKLDLLCFLLLYWDEKEGKYQVVLPLSKKQTNKCPLTFRAVQAPTLRVIKHCEGGWKCFLWENTTPEGSDHRSLLHAVGLWIPFLVNLWGMQDTDFSVFQLAKDIDQMFKAIRKKLNQGQHRYKSINSGQEQNALQHRFWHFLLFLIALSIWSICSMVLNEAK